MLSRPHAALASLFALVASAVLVGGGCGGKADAAKEEPPGALKKREAARVRVTPVERREMRRTLETTTVVESEKEIRLYPRVAGTVMELRAEEGDAVAAGAVLAVLDARESQARVDEARVALLEAQDGVRKAALAEKESASRLDQMRLSAEQAGRDYERNEKAGGVISAQMLEQSRSTRDRAKNEHETAQVALERASVEAKAALTSVEKAQLALKKADLQHSWNELTAPFAGVIAQRSVKVGDSISTASVAFVLTDAFNLRAVFYRPQRELAFFQPGAHREGSLGGAIEIEATAEALPQARFRGRILLVSPSIDAQSGSFKVTVRLDPATEKDAAHALLPGMLVKLAIVTDRHPQALVVPKRALRREGEASLLFVAREGRAHRVEVREGFQEGDLIEVTPVLEAGLAEGDQVVVVGNRELEEDSEVELETPAAPAPPPAAPETPAEAPAAAPAGTPSQG